MALVVVAAIGLRVKQFVDQKHPHLAEVTVAGHVFRAEIADTDAKKELGLGNRDSLSVDAAMIFPMGSLRRWVFWMKDMRFPIDIVWIADNSVVDISANAPVPSPNSDPVTFSPSDPADTVLELNAGDANRYGIRVGAGVQVRVLK